MSDSLALDETALHSAILDRVSDGVVALDREWRYTYVNAAAAEMLGPRAKVGTHIWTQFPEVVGQPFHQHCERAMREQRPSHFEDYHAPWERWFSNSIHPSEDGLTIIFREITDLKLTEVAVRASEERLRLALDAAHIGTFDWDVLRGRLTWSRWHTEMWGLRPGEFRGTYEAFAERVHPDDLPGVNGEVARCIAARQPYAHEFRVVWPDGSVHWVTAAGEFEFDAAGRAVRMRGAVIESTARKEAEAALRRERDFSDAALNSLPGIFYLYGEDLRLQRWNGNFERVSGYDAAELAHMSPLDFFAGGEKELLAARIREVFESGEASVEAEFVARDGTRTPFYFTGRRTEIDGRKCLLGVGIDITERKRAVDALHHLSHRLLHAEDEERRRIAKELHDSTAQDLVAVMLNLSTLRDVLAPLAPQPEQILEDSAALVENCANEIRTLSYVLHPPRLDETGLPGALTEYAAGLGARAGIRIQVEAAPDFGRLSEELEIALFRVAQESLGNVVRHSGSDAATIRLTRDRNSVVLEIEDYGCGMPPDDATRSSVRGIGIAGMRERLQYLGGCLAMERTGHGTNVRATLPLKDATL